MPSNDVAAGPAVLEFEADTASKLKKGVHKPIYARVFSKKAKKGKTTKRLHMLVNPYAGQQKRKEDR